MKEQIIAKSYAQAAIVLGKEKKFEIAKEFTKLQELINGSNDLENVLFLDVFTIDEKKNVFNALAGKAGLNSIVSHFVDYLIQEKRIGLLPMIYKELIVLDDHEKGFLRGTIEGSEASLDQAILAQIKTALKNKIGKEADITYVQNKNLTAGYKITVEDYQLDATVDHQLDEFKNSIVL
jgi:F-type H+-transporting ATPase subunit delta